MHKSAIYAGRVRHRRMRPVPHAFHNRLFMMYLDLDELPEASARMARLRDRLEEGLLERIEGLQVSSRNVPRTPNTLHLSLARIESDALLSLLDEAGIALSAGSACSRTPCPGPAPRGAVSLTPSRSCDDLVRWAS